MTGSLPYIGEVRLLVAVAASAWLFAASSAKAQTVKSDPNGFTGSASCRECHLDTYNNFFRNPHSQSIASGKEKPENTGCESCHGAGKEHIEWFGDRTKSRVIPELKIEDIVNLCLNCHAKDFPRAEIRRSAHIQANMACTDCHSIHRPRSPKGLLARKQTDLCYSCHTQVRAQFSMPFKHRVNEGAMQCTDCHNPHGGPSQASGMALRQRMLTPAASGEETCFKCHTDKRGPFVFEHAAVRADGCQSCHVPHGSTNARMLKRPVVFTLCLECHNGAANFGRQRDGILTQTSTHNMTNPRYQNCTTCHLRIHGSNADERFLR